MVETSQAVQQAQDVEGGKKGGEGTDQGRERLTRMERCRNWQLDGLESRAPSGVRVRVPPSPLTEHDGAVVELARHPIAELANRTSSIIVYIHNTRSSNESERAIGSKESSV